MSTPTPPIPSKSSSKPADCAPPNCAVSTGSAWVPWPPKMHMEDHGWWWLKDKKDYEREPIVVHLNCNMAMKIGVCFNELDDLPVEWETAECAPCLLPPNNQGRTADTNLNQTP